MAYRFGYACSYRSHFTETFIGTSCLLPWCQVSFLFYFFFYFFLLFPTPLSTSIYILEIVLKASFRLAPYLQLLGVNFVVVNAGSWWCNSPMLCNFGVWASAAEVLFLEITPWFKRSTYENILNLPVWDPAKPGFMLTKLLKTPPIECLPTSSENF